MLLDGKFTYPPVCALRTETKAMIGKTKRLNVQRGAAGYSAGEGETWRKRKKEKREGEKKRNSHKSTVPSTKRAHTQAAELVWRFPVAASH